MGCTEVFITGFGIVTAAGLNAGEMYQALIHGKSGIGPARYLKTTHKNDIPVGEVRLSNQEMKDLIDLPANNNLTRTTLLGLLAAREAVEHAGITDMAGCKNGLVSASTVGGMSSSERYWDKYLKTDAYDDYILKHDLGVSTAQIARFFGIRDYISTISTACSSSANALMLGVRLIKNGLVDRVIAGGTDALSKFTLNGFNSLMILDREPTRPFDRDRKGLNLGEGAAYLVLESGENVEQDGKTVYGKITGFANTNDSYHQTASSEDGYGCYLSMYGALKMAGITPSDIDYINVHGTGTSNNDETEGRAMLKLFGASLPPFSSTKPFTGHTLGAAGAVEAVISLLAINHQVIFPNLNFRNPIDGLGMIPVTGLECSVVENVLSNSLGFGGNDASLVISKSS
jgi:3-oxoacyl-[acyl-carrier-protein] synthase-1